MLEICLDIALLETNFRQSNNLELKFMFKVKHNLEDEGFELINLESAILVLTVVIERYDNKGVRSAKLK